MSAQIAHQHKHEAKHSSEFYSIRLKVNKTESIEGECPVDVYNSIVKLFEQFGDNQLNDILGQVPTQSKVMQENSNVLSDTEDTIEGITPDNKHENFQKNISDLVNKGTASIKGYSRTMEEGQGSKVELLTQHTSMRKLNLTESVVVVSSPVLSLTSQPIETLLVEGEFGSDSEAVLALNWPILVKRALRRITINTRF